jgi:cob(I)alamin adenosyltransferase
MSHEAEILRAKIAEAKRQMQSPSQAAEAVIREWCNRPTAAQIEEAQQSLLALRAELSHPKYKVPKKLLTPGESATHEEELRQISQQIYKLQGFLGIR